MVLEFVLLQLQNMNLMHSLRDGSPPFHGKEAIKRENGSVSYGEPLQGDEKKEGCRLFVTGF